jgi:hypothetical protein
MESTGLLIDLHVMVAYVRSQGHAGKKSCSHLPSPTANELPSFFVGFFDAKDR